MRHLLIALGLLVLSAGCLGDKEPVPFPRLDAALDGLADSFEGEEPTDEPEDRACDDHQDCTDDELCFERECVDRETVLSNCSDDDDCPDGFICVEEDRCEEE